MDTIAGFTLCAVLMGIAYGIPGILSTEVKPDTNGHSKWMMPGLLEMRPATFAEVNSAVNVFILSFVALLVWVALFT